MGWRPHVEGRRQNVQRPSEWRAGARHTCMEWPLESKDAERSLGAANGGDAHAQLCGAASGGRLVCACGRTASRANEKVRWDWHKDHLDVCSKFFNITNEFRISETRKIFFLSRK